MFDGKGLFGFERINLQLMRKKESSDTITLCYSIRHYMQTILLDRTNILTDSVGHAYRHFKLHTRFLRCQFFQKRS